MEAIEKVTTFGAIGLCISIGALIGYFIGKAF
jgi:hypothetical protein